MMLSRVLYQDNALSRSERTNSSHLLWSSAQAVQLFDILLGLNSIFAFSPVEKWDICGPPHSVVIDESCLKSICHLERSVV
jgi:hypothetical protein